MFSVRQLSKKTGMSRASIREAIEEYDLQPAAWKMIPESAKEKGWEDVPLYDEDEFLAIVDQRRRDVEARRPSVWSHLGAIL